MNNLSNISFYKKSNFAIAFFFLEKKKREALSIFYNFARYVDDIADSKKLPTNIKIEKLLEIKQRIDKIYSNIDLNDEFSKLRDIIKYYNIPKTCFDELINGMLYDCKDVDVKTMDELERYMYKVASVVGIAVLKISGYKGNNLYEIARYSGYAVQMTNILRDFYEDYNNNRIYIPKEHRIKILGSEKIDINDTDKIKKLIEFEKNINKNYYEISSKLIREYKTSSLFVSSLMKNIYKEILNEINFESIKKNHKISNYTRIKSLINSILEIYF